MGISVKGVSSNTLVSETGLMETPITGNTQLPETMPWKWGVSRVSRNKRFQEIVVFSNYNYFNGHFRNGGYQ
jgi:hypothetical protein